jgi:hypothetical protein
MIAAQGELFDEWLAELAKASIRLVHGWDEDLRRGFYEGQPSAWRNYYNAGLTPEDAVRADMAEWSNA